MTHLNPLDVGASKKVRCKGFTHLARATRSEAKRPYGLKQRGSLTSSRRSLCPASSQPQLWRFSSPPVPTQRLGRDSPEICTHRRWVTTPKGGPPPNLPNPPILACPSQVTPNESRANATRGGTRACTLRDQLLIN